MSEMRIDHEISGVTRLTRNLPRSDCQFSPLAATYFLVNYSWEFVLNPVINICLISLYILGRMYMLSTSSSFNPFTRIKFPNVEVDRRALLIPQCSQTVGGSGWLNFCQNHYVSQRNFLFVNSLL